ncbi:hypothetical protein [Piscirickettsia salmonis]|nr:hypothetical protein [Piscirickettsia salmonis]
MLSTPWLAVKEVSEKLLIEPALNNVRYLPGEMLYKLMALP